MAQLKDKNKLLAPLELFTSLFVLAFLGLMFVYFLFM